MIPIKPTDVDRFDLHKPKDWDDTKGECSTLTVVPIEFAGVMAAASMWQPSAEEREQIAKGYPIVLMVCGPAHPPVALGVATHPTRIKEA